jgi:hypothetical protein
MWGRRIGEVVGKQEIEVQKRRIYTRNTYTVYGGGGGGSNKLYTYCRGGARCLERRLEILQENGEVVYHFLRYSARPYIVIEITNFFRPSTLELKLLSSRIRGGLRVVPINRPCLPTQSPMFQIH